MKILFICTENYGGLLPFGASIINSFDGEDVTCLLVCSKNSDYRGNIEEGSKRQVVYIDEPDHKVLRFLFRLFPWKVWRAFRKICGRQPYDIIHLLTEDTGLAFVAGSLQRRGAVVYTVHDLEPHEASHQSFLHRIRRQLLVDYRVKVLLRRCRNLVTCNRRQYELLLQRFPQKRVYYHPFPPLITAKVKNGRQEVPELAGVAPYFLFFGRIEKYKGVDLLYQAYLSNPALQEVPLVIAGSGYLYFNRHGEKEKNVHFVNRYIAEEEIAWLYRHSLCTVYPYVSATQSGVTSLSFYFQKPIIASDIGFFRDELEGQSGVHLFKAGDEESLSEQMVRVLREGSAETGGERRSEGTGAVHETLLAIYQDILHQSKGHGS